MEKPKVLSPQSHGAKSMTEYHWDCIGPDLTELILSYLPIPSIIVAASVCKFWNSIIHSNSFKTRKNNPSWFFLSLQLRKFPDQNKLFAFIPESESWIKLPNTTLLSNHPITASAGCPLGKDGKIMIPGVLINTAYCQTSIDQKQHKHLTVGGVDLINIGASVAVDLPHLHTPVVVPCCSALFKGKLYVFHLYKNWITSFDLEKRSWSDLKTLRPPPGVMVVSLVSCGDRLVLAGLMYRGNDRYEFNLWRIDEKTLEFSEVGIMPGELLSCFLRGVEFMRSYPSMFLVNGLVLLSVACVCEMIDSGKCRWRGVPNMPECAHYDAVISFTCHVSLDDFLGNGKNHLDS